MKTTIRLPDDVAERLKEAAERDRRSVHAQMLVYIERGLEQEAPRRPKLGLGETELFGSEITR
jgi:predicted transcriptional regulator